MMRVVFAFVIVLAAGMTARVDAATNIAAARALAEDTEVEIGPVTVASTNDVTGSGFAFCVQDDTGGCTLYWGSGDRQKGYAMLSDNNIGPGDRITLRGSNSWYAALYELANVAFVSKDATGAPPDPVVISINDMQNGSPTGHILQSVLVELGDVSFREAGQTFAGASNYNVTNALGTNAVVRVQDNADPLVGQSIPSGPVTIRGIMSQFDFSGGTNSLNGYQLLPLAVIPDAPQVDPNILVETNANCGIIYPGVPRDYRLFIRNGGVSNDLLVSAVAPVAGATGAISIVTPPLPITIAPGGNVTGVVTYVAGVPGTAHTAVYSIASSDASTPTVNVEISGSVATGPVAAVWINEVAYDDTLSDDQQEFIELCGPAGLSLQGWRIELWNGNPFDVTNYGSHTIGDFTLPDDTLGYGFYVMVTSDSIVPGDEQAEIDNIQNGPADAIRLVDAGGATRHFFQYETDWCTNFPPGPPDDLTWQSHTSSNYTSLQLGGEGSERTDFAWEWMLFSPGAVNSNQVLPEPALALAAGVFCALIGRRYAVGA